MKRIALVLGLLITMLACNITSVGIGTSPTPAITALPAAGVTDTPPLPTIQYPQGLIAHYPLTADLNDATGNNDPMTAQNAPLVPGSGLSCNGKYLAVDPTGCEIETPRLTTLDLGAFTISVQFLVPDVWNIPNPVFVGGPGWRWLAYELNKDGSIQLIYNNSQAVACSVTYQLNTWHLATITYDGQTATLYLDKTPGCSATAALETNNEKRVLALNPADGTTFYGMLRELRIYNGVVNPSEIPFP